MNQRSRISKTKKPRRPTVEASGEFLGFLIGISLSDNQTPLTQKGTRSGLSALGKITAQAWLDLSSQSGVRVDEIVFRSSEIEGLIFLSPNHTDRKLGLLIRLLKSRIAQSVKEKGLSLSPWKKIYQSRPLATKQEVVLARKHIVMEAMTRRKTPA